jgi:hypothetical protein
MKNVVCIAEKIKVGDVCNQKTGCLCDDADANNPALARKCLQNEKCLKFDNKIVCANVAAPKPKAIVCQNPIECNCALENTKAKGGSPSDKEILITACIRGNTCTFEDNKPVCQFPSKKQILDNGDLCLNKKGHCTCPSREGLPSSTCEPGQTCYNKNGGSPSCLGTFNKYSCQTKNECLCNREVLPGEKTGYCGKILSDKSKQLEVKELTDIEIISRAQILILSKNLSYERTKRVILVD